jgi:NAD(P)-dependent dehydrogenase (short-subunit alcohol dehydrogenase family)
VVVGVADAVGTACALALAGDDALVIAIDDDVAACDRVVAAVEERGGQAVAFTADVADEAALMTVARDVERQVSAVHALVNAHFAIEWVTLEASTMAGWETVVRRNVLGPVAATRAFLPLLKQGGGAPGGAAIVHLGSVDGFQGNPMVPSYSVSKGAIPAMTHVMAFELAPFGIRVNCVARAAVESSPAVASRLHDDAMACTPLGRPARAEEISATVAFLAGPAASYVTGSTLVVDGGRTGLTPGTAIRPSGPKIE